MSEFDFLSRIPLGQYIPTNSIIHRLDPRAKIIIFGVLLIAITFTPSQLGLSIGIAALLLALLLSKVPIGFALKGLLVPLPFLLIIAIIQVFFYSSALDPNILIKLGKLNITSGGLLAGVMLLIRFAGLILCLSLVSFVTSTSELLHGLTKILSPLNRVGIHDRAGDTALLGRLDKRSGLTRSLLRVRPSLPYFLRGLFQVGAFALPHAELAVSRHHQQGNQG